MISNTKKRVEKKMTRKQRNKIPKICTKTRDPFLENPYNFPGPESYF